MAAKRKSAAGRTRTGIVFYLIPVLQRCLGIASRAITHVMARLDRIAFRLARDVER